MAQINNMVRLSRREWAILRELIASCGGAIPSGQLLSKLLKPDGADGARHLYKYIGRLRKKLEPDPQNPSRIFLERGQGYRLEGPDSSWPVIVHPDGIFLGDAPPPAQSDPSVT